jgi:CubicO group peptidase (beta-lactamase class C family)
MTSTRAGRTTATLGALVFVAAFAAYGGRAAAGVGSGADRDAQRISRVERGLLPTVALRGGRDTAYTLADRLVRYGVPGVSVAVIDGGRVAWARGYGALEAGDARHVDTTTLFQAGSISKAVTAVAALRLVERGALQLDEDVNLRLVSWKVPPSEWTRERPVTLRGLLSHGAGLNVPSFPGYEAGAPVPTLLEVLDGAPPANTPPVRVEIAPGTEWRYSGGGLTVAQQLIIDASGRPFAELLRETVLDRAGMTRTVAEQPLSAARAASAATGHSAGAPVAGRWHTYPELAAAGLWSTAPDLARFGVAVLRAIRRERGALLEPAIARAMVTRQIGDWGLGFALGGGTVPGDSATVGHGGSTVGYTARLLVLPATRQGIAVMTNGESEALIDEIERAVAREYAWPVRPRVEKTLAAVDPGGFAALAGRYRVELGDRTFDFVVRVDGTGEGRRLVITGPSGRPGELLPLSELRFFSQDTGNEFTFAREGNVTTRMEIDQQGQRFTALRMP